MQATQEISNHLVSTLAEELTQALHHFEDYSPGVIVRARSDEALEQQKALVQTMYRLQHLRIEVANLFQKFVDAPNGSFKETEDFFLRSIGLELAHRKDTPLLELEKLGNTFNLNFADSVKQTLVNLR